MTGPRRRVEVTRVRAVAVESRQSEQVLGAFWKWSCQGLAGGLDGVCETATGVTHTSRAFWSHLMEGKNPE